jgi:hypothetical protein
VHDIAHRVGIRIEKAGNFRAQVGIGTRPLNLRGGGGMRRISGAHDSSSIIFTKYVYVLQSSCQLI